MLASSGPRPRVPGVHEQPGPLGSLDTLGDPVVSDGPSMGPPVLPRASWLRSAPPDQGDYDRLPSAETLDEVRRLARRQQTLLAIRMYREQTGQKLGPAKAAVEAMALDALDD